jgi:transcriptional regulator with PAS, ATPase and Fis domain
MNAHNQQVEAIDGDIDRRVLLSNCDPFSDIIGSSASIRRAKDLLARIAKSPASTVLIGGESGTGKDLAARAIHRASSRAARPFVSINCSALPSNLLESELFGHERGAFTDAKARKPGLAEEAEGGTLFLDEIGEMDLGLQAKLLHFLDDKSFRRVGGCSDLQADLRVVAATNVDLADAIAAGRFRKDLYYRLAVLMVELPPLRERGSDVVEIVEHLLVSFSRKFDMPRRRLAPEAERWLCQQTWPGNIRELKNAVERVVLLAQHEYLGVEDFSLVPGPRVRVDDRSDGAFVLPVGGLDLAALERDLVIQALTRTDGNITRAGRLLGLTRDQVRYRIDKFELLDFRTTGRGDSDVVAPWAPPTAASVSPPRPTTGDSESS